MSHKAVKEPFDRDLVRRFRNRRAGAMANHNFLINWTARNLIERLELVRRKFPLVLQIGARHEPALDEALKKSAGCTELVTCDLAERLLAEREGLCVACDEEFLPFAPGAFDLVLSPFSLHTVNDLPGVFIQIRRILKPDGLFLAAFPGGETLGELRQALMQAELAVRGGASPRVAPFADKQQAGALLQRAGFALPVVDSEKVEVGYESIYALSGDLRGMAESNSVIARSREVPGRALWKRADEIYRAKFSGADGRLTATFEIIFVIGWAPHESQPRPLRPGSAASRLADALGTTETGSGEPAKP